MKADELMTPTVTTCSPSDSLEQAAHLMWEGDVGCLVVTDAERHPVGMLTDRDVAMAAYTSGARLRDVPVASAMAHEVRSCSTTAPIGEIESLMQSARIRRVPVVDSEGRLLGIVTLGDLARVTQASPLRMAAIPGVARTLASVTERRRPAVAAAAQ